MTGIDRSVILTEILPFLILKVSSAKDDCDRIIGPMKWAIHIYYNDGHNILPHCSLSYY